MRLIERMHRMDFIFTSSVSSNSLTHTLENCELTVLYYEADISEDEIRELILEHAKECRDFNKMSDISDKIIIMPTKMAENFKAIIHADEKGDER